MGAALPAKCFFLKDRILPGDGHNHQGEAPLLRMDDNVTYPAHAEHE